MEATGGFEPPIRVLQTPALTTWLRRPHLVPRRGFEPLRPYEHRPLKTACLPIPPPRQRRICYRKLEVGGKRFLRYLRMSWCRALASTRSRRAGVIGAEFVAEAL